MLFRPTEVAGAFVVVAEPHADERGHFARIFCRDEFAAQGLHTDFLQASVSHNHRRGTLRGMHYQAAPAAEVKLVRCTRGAILDVVVDLRPDSPSYGRHLSVRLSPDDPAVLYVPEGCAHGFQTLEDGTDVEYHISERYKPGLGRGLRYDDPALGVDWPVPVSVIAAKDLAWPPWQRSASLTSSRS